MFNKGTEKGSIGLIPIGGHEQPISTAGASLEWKKAQKNPKKKIASDPIKRIIPAFSPVTTAVVCFPIKVLSRTISRHHVNIFNIINNKEIRRGSKFLVWNQSPNAANVASAANALVIGQGLRWTKWKGWRIIQQNVDLVKF